MNQEKLLNFTIRNEEERDYRAVESLTRKAFWKEEKVAELGIGCDEHFLAHQLRMSEDFVAELDFVAEYEGNVIGNIMYTIGSLHLSNGTELEVLTFGPLSVEPQYQRKGVGSALVTYSLEEAKRMGFDAVVIFGHPEYYPRFGFKEALEYNISTKDDKNFPAFMALELFEGSLHGMGASFHESSAYKMDPKAIVEFDKLFR